MAAVCRVLQKKGCRKTKQILRRNLDVREEPVEWSPGIEVLNCRNVTKEDED